MLKKSKKSGSEVSYNDLEKVGGGRIVNIEKHPEVVNDIPEDLISKWAEGGWEFAILDNKSGKLLDFAVDADEACDLNAEYNKDMASRILKSAHHVSKNRPYFT